MRSIFAAVITVLLFAVPAAASAAEAADLDASAKRKLEKASEYLDDIKSMRTEFLQISSTGETAKGTILLSRPKHLRIDYDPPTPILIIADGEYLSYVDTELKQVNHIPVEETPAGFLLRDDFTFDGGDLTVTGFEQSANAFRISMVRKSDPLAGQLTLVFSESPMRLRKWTIVDAQGVTTDVTLINSRFDVPIAKDNFDTNFMTFDLGR